MIYHVLLFIYGFIFKTFNCKTCQGLFLLCADTENCGIQEGVLTFSHDCMCGIFNPHSDPLSERTWF